MHGEVCLILAVLITNRAGERLNVATSCMQLTVDAVHCVFRKIALAVVTFVESASG